MSNGADRRARRRHILIRGVAIGVAAAVFREKIREILAALNRVDNRMPAYEAPVKRLITSIDGHRSVLNKNELDVMTAVRGYYTGARHVRYMQTLKKRMAAQQRFLTFCNDKFDRIMNRQQPEIQSYEALYLAYQRVLDAYDTAYAAKTDAIKTVLDKYPAAGALFPYQKKTGLFSWTK